MNFSEQLKRTDLPTFDYPFIRRASSIPDILLGGYLRLFSSRLEPMKPLALVNGMPVYDLTQPPMYSEAGARVLRTGFDYMVLKREARPINMVLMMNAACDMKCCHCSARDYMRQKRKPLSFEELSDVIAQFIDLGGASVVLSGGEPTLHPKIVELISGVPKSKAAVAMFTNGARLGELAQELRSAGLFAALVSIDSDNPAEHDERRRFPGAFVRATRAIEKLHEEKILAGISTYLNRPDHLGGKFDRMVALGERLGVQQLFVFDAVPTGELIAETETLLTGADREEIKEQVKRQNAKPSGPAIMGQSWVNSKEGFGCFAGFYQLYVNAVGDVMPCDFTPVSFGNVREEPLEKIWKRMRASEDWGKRHFECRMQDKCFRSNTIDLVPPGTQWPVPYETILELRKQGSVETVAGP
ncbi:MAG: radical SAM protein [Myxococcota bacterium]